MTAHLSPEQLDELDATGGRSGRPRLLLLLATRSYRTADLLAAADALGVEVTVGSDAPTALAGLAPGATITLPLADAEQTARAIAAFHAHYPVRAVVGLDDNTVEAAARAAELLHLRANPVAAVAAARDKLTTRRCLTEAGLAQPWCRPVAWKSELATVAAAVPYPCVLKPRDLGGSRGVIRADTASAFVAAGERISRILEAVAAEEGRPVDETLLVEGFIPGVEVAVEGLLVGGRLHPICLFDKPDPLDGPFFEETLYVTPSRLGSAIQAEIWRTAQAACDALGLVEGPVHIEIRITPAGGCHLDSAIFRPPRASRQVLDGWRRADFGAGVLKVRYGEHEIGEANAVEGPESATECRRIAESRCHVVEVAPRTIGGLCGRTLRLAAGVRLEEVVLTHALGGGASAVPAEVPPAGVMMLPISRGGVLRGVAGVAAARRLPNVAEVAITVPVGGELVPLPEGDRYLGFLFARGPDPATVEATLRDAHARLSFEIEPPAG